MTAAPALISDPGVFSLFQAVTAPFGDGYVVAWDAFESEITVKAFNGDGSVAAAEFTVGAAADDQLTPQLTPAVASLASAEPTFVVAWWQASGNGDPPEIRAQRFTTNGATNATPLGSEVTVNTSSGFPQSGPQIAALSEGAFVVVWIASKNDAEAADIYFQRFDQNGVKV